jgi:Transmembrane proteins 14C
MAFTTMIFGGLLIVLGVGGYIVTNAPTSLIPAVLGGLLLVCGFLAQSRPNISRHTMHAAAVLALLGFLGSVRGLMKLPDVIAGRFVERPAAVWTQSLMAILCLVFVALCVKSFIDARRARA